MKITTEIKRNSKLEEKTVDDIEFYLNKSYHPTLRNLLKRCYQCGRCSGVCQLSKVQKFTPSRIIQMVLEGFEDKIIESGVLWDCLTCNTCLQHCPENINFADIVRNAKYRMRNSANQNPDEYIAHKGIYTTISEIMSQSNINPERNLDWIPKECKISKKGNILYYVGCLPFFNYEFEDLTNIATSTLKIICQVEKEPIVVLKEENCCGHDLYWGQGKLKTFIKLAKKNIDMFKDAGISKIITACAECYRTFKVDYPDIFEDFSEKFEVQHIIEYVYEKWKQNKIDFITPKESDERITFTYHDPCRLSRFLPKDNKIMEKVREIFKEFRELGYDFNEMEHNKENSLCCGVNSWMNCNEKSKALRYKRMLEAKAAGNIMVTSCPKCNIHLSCIQNDFEDLSSIKILDFSEFLIDHVELKSSDKIEEVEK
ncbi:MAG: (Fe-S)-binding protein [Candidatus Hodarchaeota archaeon]